MTSFRQRNDGDRGARKPFSKAAGKPETKGGYNPAAKPREGNRSRSAEDPADWVWGWHAVAAALGNSARTPPRKLLASPDRAAMIEAKFGKLAVLEVVESVAIGQKLPTGAVHQGIALKTALLEPWSLEALADASSGVILMLDQITDPQNVGAIFRSAAAFGARGVILQDRHAPPLAGALAKAAAGAVDTIPHARVVNLSRALEKLADLGWRAVGLDGTAEASLDSVLDGRPTVIVLGSEGEGIRRLVAEHCDVLAGIAMPGGFESLNVSAAAAVALYEASRPRS